jgi:hypothetical protein
MSTLRSRCLTADHTRTVEHEDLKQTGSHALPVACPRLSVQLPMRTTIGGKWPDPKRLMFLQQREKRSLRDRRCIFLPGDYAELA